MDIEFLTVFSVSSLKMSSYSIMAFITSEKKPAVNFTEKSWYVMSLFSCYFQDFPFVFVFHQLDYKVSRCGSLWFISLGVCWSSWMCILIFFIKFGKSSAIICSNIFVFFLFLLYFWNSHCRYVGMFYDVICLLCSVHFSSFFFFLLPDEINFIDISSNSLILLSDQICCWVSLVNFLFLIFYFSALEFLFSSFL